LHSQVVATCTRKNPSDPAGESICSETINGGASVYNNDSKPPTETEQALQRISTCSSYNCGVVDN